MRIFDYDFEYLDDESLSELFSLQREGAIYTDQWVDKLKDFRHVRIAFTQAEIDEYVRSMWAYELFLSAGTPLQATTVPGIPLDIAARADEYESDPADPSFHCIAAFLGAKLEELVLYTPDDRRVILGDYGTDKLIATVKRAVDSLTPAIRCFNRREKGLSPWPIDREDDIRDLLYAMLRASISDIRREEPVPSVGGTHKFVDLYSRVA